VTDDGGSQLSAFVLDSDAHGVQPPPLHQEEWKPSRDELRRDLIATIGVMDSAALVALRRK
jgi:hypothetical protein